MGRTGSRQFAAFVYDLDRKGNRLDIDELMLMSALNSDARIDSKSAGKIIQKDSAEGASGSRGTSGNGTVESRANGDQQDLST